MPTRVATQLVFGSGPSARDCHCIGLRWDATWRFTSTTGESWVVQVVDGKMSVVHGGLGWMTRLWRSPSGAVFVSDQNKGVHVNLATLDPRSPWRVHALRGVMSGVWGIDDSFVLAWGGLGDDEELMYRWDGKKWNEMPAPPGKIHDVHGLRPDLLYAVGRKGLISRWDGNRWNDVDSPTRSVLSAVWMASEDEIYAVGAGRRVLEGSSHGWVETTVAQTPLYGVAKAGKDVWVGAASEGLQRVRRNKLQVVDEETFADHLEAHGDLLLVSSPSEIKDTRDGKTFDAIVDVKEFNALMEHRPPLWYHADRVTRASRPRT